MGLLWSKPSGTDYEKILTDLTARIAEVEGRVKKTRRQHRSVSLWCLSYGSLLYLLYGLWVFLYPRGPASVPYRPLLDALGLIGGPLLIYQTHRLLGWLYARRIAYYDARLREYRGQQKLKVEELKRTTAYYKTKGLIERFEVIDDEELVTGGGTQDKRGARLDKVAPMAASGSRPSPSAMAMTAPPPPSAAGPGAGAGALASPASPTYPLPPPLSPAAPTPPTWLDRLVDAIIGDDRHARYALVCQKCLSHNGLARPEDFDTVQYICPSCHHLNGPRRAIFSEVALPHALAASSNSSLASEIPSPMSAPAAVIPSAVDTTNGPPSASEVTPKQRERLRGGGKGPAPPVRQRRARRASARGTADDNSNSNSNGYGDDSNLDSD